MYELAKKNHDFQGSREEILHNPHIETCKRYHSSAMEYMLIPQKNSWCNFWCSDYLFLFGRNFSFALRKPACTNPSHAAPFACQNRLGTGACLASAFFSPCVMNFPIYGIYLHNVSSYSISYSTFLTMCHKITAVSFTILCVAKPKNYSIALQCAIKSKKYSIVLHYASTTFFTVS